MKSNLRVLILAKQLDGGTGTFVTQLIKLKSMFSGKYEFKLLALETPQFRLKDSFSFPIDFHKSQVRQPYYYRLTPFALARLIQEFDWLNKEVNKFNPHIILTIDSHCAFLGGVIKLLSPEINLVLTIHNNLRAVTFHKLTPIGRFIMLCVCHWIFNQADTVVGVSTGVREDTKRLFGINKPVITIYNGLNISSLEPNKNKKGERTKNALKLVSVGRLAPQKDFRTLIYAVNILNKEIPHLHLLILGDGSERPELQKLIDCLALTKKIKILGWLKRASTFLKRADIFVLSSHFEGFSYALLEAMNLGIPVISTDTPFGPEEILGGGKFGILVKPADPPALADAIRSLSTNHHLYKRMAVAAYQRSRFFTELKMLQSYHHLFQSLVRITNSQLKAIP